MVHKITFVAVLNEQAQSHSYVCWIICICSILRTWPVTVIIIAVVVVEIIIYTYKKCKQ